MVSTVKYILGILAIYYGYTYLQHQYDLARYNQLENLIISNTNEVINATAAANAGDMSKQIYIDKRTNKGYLGAALM